MGCRHDQRLPPFIAHYATRFDYAAGHRVISVGGLQ